LGEVGLGGKKIAWTHFPQFAKPLAVTGKYDAVFYGHTHKKHEEKIGKTLLVNPGNIMGNPGPASFAVYDTSSDSVDFFDI